MNVLLIILAVFFAELVVLYFSSHLITNSLAKLFYRHIKSYKTTINLFAIFFLPGTIIHELSHILIAGVLLVEVGEIEFLPEFKEDGVRLGTAQIGKTDIFRRTIIGIAPVLVGIFLIGALVWYFQTLQFADNKWLILGLVFFGYLLLVISNTMFSSKKDLEGAIGGFLFLAGIIACLLIFKIHQPFYWIQSILVQYQDLIVKFLLFLMVPILINLGLWLLIKIFFRPRFRQVN